jgi:hydroxymethylbilane synthase
VKSSVVIGTRSSPLALWQTEFVRSALLRQFPHLQFEVRTIKTTGDKILDSPLSKIGDKGLFTREIEHALLAGEIDLAVHSLKDLPTQVPDGLMIAAITARADTRDVLISNDGYTLRTLPMGARIATGSLRRRAQLLALRPDLEIFDMRGNLNTRFKKFDERQALAREHPEHLDGMLLAFAGVHRLELDERISQIISHDEILPAVGQGALAIETRLDDAATHALVAPLNDYATELCTKAERSLLRHLEGGCQIPIGAFASLIGEHLTLSAFIGTVDGKHYLRRSLSCVLAGNFSARLERAEQLGIELGEKLLARGGRDILSSIRS